MKKLLLVILLSPLFYVYGAEFTLSGGFDLAFGLRWMTSIETDINGKTYKSDELKINEFNSIIAPGASILLRRQEADGQSGAMTKIRFFWLSYIETVFTASSPTSSLSYGYNISNTLSDFDTAFFIDLCTGWTKIITLGNKKSNLLLDFGFAGNVIIVENEDIAEKALGFGPMFNGGFQLGLTDHLKFEAGLNVEFLLSIGGRSEPGASFWGIGFMMPYTQYLAIGYKF